jgi:nucleotide-binding universal stress UspA family protein
MIVSKKQILIATDGSTYSDQALHYVARLFGCQQETTFHVLTCTSPSHSALPESTDNKNSLFPSSAENESRYSAANSCLNQAKERLIRLGISADRITFSVVAGNNIARNIQAEAEHLLVDSILVARRGIGFVGEMLLGSVSADLFRRCHQVPLWIIDGEVTLKNILISVDRSCHSLLAVDHLAHILSGRSDIKIFLYHCQRFFRSKVIYEREHFYQKWDKNWCDDYLSSQENVYTGPCQLLHEAGIPKDQINILPEATHIDESSSIISQAHRYECGTIVMGRPRAGMARGLWGEVATRTIKHTQDMALWIIG